MSKPKAVKTARKRATPAETVLVLRTCAADMTAHGGFRWPESGEVSAPDWNPAPICGQGLHGAKWLVVEVVAADVVKLGGKVKFPRGGGDYGTSTSGDYGTSTSGDYGTSTSGNGGTSTSGNGGTSTSGNGGTSTSGNGGTSTSGDYGTSTSGDYGTSTSGYGGTLALRWYDSDADRYRLAIAYVGEGGILPNKPYRLDVTRDAAGVLCAVFVKAS